MSANQAISAFDLDKALKELWASDDLESRHKAAENLSRIASKADDDTLRELSNSVNQFLDFLHDPDPLLKAYACCILANVAFLDIGQNRVLEARAVPILVKLLRQKGDTKVILHSTAAIQNLTYKNAACCEVVLAGGGEKMLRKLLSHKSEPITQFAAGALANLHLYRRSAEDRRKGGGGGKINKKVKAILRRKMVKQETPGTQDDDTGPEEEAAMRIQAHYRGFQCRKDAQQAATPAAPISRYGAPFKVADVRAEVANWKSDPVYRSGVSPLGRGPGLGGPGLKPHRLQPLSAPLEPINGPRNGTLPPLAPLGGVNMAPPKTKHSVPYNHSVGATNGTAVSMPSGKPLPRLGPMER